APSTSESSAGAAAQAGNTALERTAPTNTSATGSAVSNGSDRTSAPTDSSSDNTAAQPSGSTGSDSTSTTSAQGTGNDFSTTAATAPAASATTSSSGGFYTQNGVIYSPDGKPFVAKGFGITPQDAVNDFSYIQQNLDSNYVR